MIELDLRRLRQLHELEQRGTLTAVAAALGYTPSAVSQQLAVLEKEVGVRLLERVGRGVRLTDAGRLLSQHARVLLSAAEAAGADLASLTGEVRGTVRAGGMQSALRHVLIPAMGRLQTEHPQVRVQLLEVEFEQALPELRLGTLDVVVSDEYYDHPRPRPAGLDFAPLLDEPLKLVLSAQHPRVGQPGPIALAALRDDVWVTSLAGTGIHALMLSACRSLGGYEPDMRHRSNDADVHLDLVRTTGAVALLPTLSLPATDPTLAVRDIAGAAIRRRLIVVTRDTPLAPGLSNFLTAVKSQADQLGRR